MCVYMEMVTMWSLGEKKDKEYPSAQYAVTVFANKDLGSILGSEFACSSWVLCGFPLGALISPAIRNMDRMIISKQCTQMQPNALMLIWI